MIAGYGRALTWVLDRQPLTLLVAMLTLVFTVLLYYEIPKGFFPVQDTGLIQAITEASQSVSYQQMSVLQNRLAEAVLKDPDVVNLSSYVGVDGTNRTLNTGRFLITLKPHDERNLSASTIIQRLQREVAGVIGITLYMQPVQDLTIDSTITRAPYNFVLEDANPTEFATWVPKLVDRLNQLPQLSGVASDLQQQGLAVDLVIDRATASRFGITPATVDNALYDAFGQRIVSTIYTQSNQYRVILELDPALQRSLAGLSSIYLPSSSSATNGQVPLSAITHIEQRTGPAGDHPLRPVPRDHDFVQYRSGLLDRFRDCRDPAGRKRYRPAQELHHRVSRHSRGVSVLAEQRGVSVPRRHRGDVYRARRALRELHSPDHHSVDPAVRRRRRAAVADGCSATISTSFRSSASFCLIGIVKKNGIMMIDFALEAERVEGLPPREAIYQACLLRFRPIMMTTMAAILGALPLMLGTGTGSELRHPLGLVLVGGLIVSQLLTLFTTPVIYLYFDRLALRLTGRPAAGPLARGEPAE